MNSSMRTDGRIGCLRAMRNVEVAFRNFANVVQNTQKERRVQKFCNLNKHWIGQADIFEA
jgi:hypothetical protein